MSSRPSIANRSASALSCPKCGHVPDAFCDIPLASPVSDLLNCNTAASESDANVIRSSLSIVETRLSLIDAEIVQLQRRLAVLKSSREKLCEFSDLHRGLLSSIRRLPPEVLASIFRELAGPTFGTVFQPSLTCKYWRNVATSTATLWSNMVIVAAPGKEKTEEAILEMWLSRSKGCPITFTFHIPYYNPAVRTHPCIMPLLANAHRWRHAKFIMPSWKFETLQATRVHFPLLETLSIERYHEDNFPRLYDFTTFQTAPNLRSLSLHRRVSESTIEVPWSQLTTLTLFGDYTADDCLDILQKATQLSTLLLSLHEEAVPRPSAIFSHTHLRQLTIVYGRQSQNLISRLALPALQDFNYYGGDENFSMVHLSSLFSRCFAPLRRLILTSKTFHVTSGMLIQFLQLCPTLVELAIMLDCASAIDNKVLKRLTHAPNNEPTCCLAPKLQTIDFGVHHLFNYESFVRMIESRWRFYLNDCGAPNHEEVHQIKDVKICRTDYHRAEDEPEDGAESPSFAILRQFREEGLRVRAMGYDMVDVELEDYPFSDIAEAQSSLTGYESVYLDTLIQSIQSA